MAAAPEIFGPTVTSASEASRRLLGRFPERAEFGEFAAGFRDIGALSSQVVVDGAAQAGIGNEVCGIGRLGQVAACDLVLALRAGLDVFATAVDRKFDRLIVADLEMQEGVM